MLTTVPRILRKLSALASRGDGRTHLEGVRVAIQKDRVRYEVTDVVCALRVDEAAPTPPEEFPSRDVPVPTDETAAATVPVETWDAAMRFRVKPRQTLPVLQRTLVGLRADRVTFLGTDLERDDVQQGVPVAGTWPDLDYVTPKEEPTVRVNLDVHRLKALMDVLATLQLRPFVVTVEVRDALTVLKITGATADGLEVTALLMPCR